MVAEGPDAPQGGTDARPERSAAFESFLRGPVAEPGELPGRSRLALASLVPGVIGFLWPLGVVLAVAALLRIRRTKRTGAWAAWTGLALCSLWGVFGTSLSWDGTSNDRETRTVSGYDLKVGDCFGPGPESASLGRDVLAVPCSRLHHGEVFGFADLGDAVYGDAGDRAGAAADACRAAAVGQLTADGPTPDGLGVDYLLPSGNTLLNRSHTRVTCAFVSSATGWTDSILAEPADT